MEWNKKVAVITGAGGTLLGGFARKLASKGTKVAVLSKELDHAQHTVDKIASDGGTAKAYACNVLNKENLTKVEQQIYKDFGQYHILINGAGGNMPKATTTNEIFTPEDLNDPKIRSFFDLDVSEIEKIFSLNFTSTLITTQIFAKRLLEVTETTIINFSSMSAQNPMTKVPCYSAAKAAVDNLTKWLAVHFAERGLRVNAIAPGFFLTNQNRNLLTNSDGSLTVRSHKIIEHTPMKRFGKVSDLFGTLLWLCDEKASGFVTGSIVGVDGGFQAYAGV
ncbi:MAG: SDR family oxidoreductase [Endomicrobium sp.]|jgi:NAD(P)-dependent dehydrogenase (short-subunit alcohol dehydrogenase family)|nr:SDR family oxidoreductase [Endomicrobium sp.]